MKEFQIYCQINCKEYAERIIEEFLWGIAEAITKSIPLRVIEEVYKGVTNEILKDIVESVSRQKYRRAGIEEKKISEMSENFPKEEPKEFLHKYPKGLPKNFQNGITEMLKKYC